MGLGLGPCLAWLLGDYEKHWDIPLSWGSLQKGGSGSEGRKSLFWNRWHRVPIGLEASGKELGQHSPVPPHFGIQ